MPTMGYSVWGSLQRTGRGDSVAVPLDPGIVRLDTAAPAEGEGGELSTTKDV
jgi:hypothetical protein